MPIWEQDRVLYDEDVWSSLPGLLEDLIERDQASFAIVESLPAGEPRLFGGVAFVRPEYISQARSGASTLPNIVLRAVLENRKPLLSPKEVAEENARGELHLMTFFGNVNVINLSNPEQADFYRTSNEGFRFFIFGYSLRSIWFEVRPPHHVEELRQQGMRVDRQIALAGDRTATLMRLTREDALANPYARFSAYFFPPKPRFAFSLREQRLIEYALLEASDADAASELNLSEDAIKKRWRSIYAKVEDIDPHLLLGVTSGTARRRTLLHYLRQHLEELRPYRDVILRPD
jgi:hypothetical protein